MPSNSLEFESTQVSISWAFVGVGEPWTRRLLILYISAFMYIIYFSTYISCINSKESLLNK